jgi:hypothetical protein
MYMIDEMRRIAMPSIRIRMDNGLAERVMAALEGRL